MNKVVISCQCGHRIMRRDVLQMRFYLSLFGPSYVSVHYRCGRCKRLGKQLVEEHRWAGFGTDRKKEGAKELVRPKEERRRFETLGDITPEELVDFHFALEGTGLLDESE